MSNPNFDLMGKVAVVTGGGGVLGGSISKSLLEAGVVVIILDIREEAIERRMTELNGLGEVHGLVCDILNMESLKSVSAQVVELYGQIDILVNAAGGNIPGATLSEDQTIFDMKMVDFNKVTDLNINGTVMPCMVFGEVMAKNGKGSIINISSMAT